MSELISKRLPTVKEFVKANWLKMAFCVGLAVASAFFGYNLAPRKAWWQVW